MKKLVAILLAAMLVLCLFGCGKEEPVDDGTMKTFTVVVVHADGCEVKREYKTDQPYVGPVLEADGLIEGNQGPYGMEISKVDGEEAVYATHNAYWALLEDGEYAMQGIDTTPVVDGRTYKLVYTRAS